MKASIASLIVAVAIFDNVAVYAQPGPAQTGNGEFAKLNSVHTEPDAHIHLNEKLALSTDPEAEINNTTVEATVMPEENLEYADESLIKSEETDYPAAENKLRGDEVAALEEEDTNDSLPPADKELDDDESLAYNKETLIDTPPSGESDYEDELPTPDDDEAKVISEETDDDKPADLTVSEGYHYDGDLEPFANYTTSTVYSTVTSTVTDCATTVTFCPEIGSVVTKTISMYTTICPVTTTAPSVPLVTAPAMPKIPEVSYLTKTIESTIWYTVTDCSLNEIDCPIGEETSTVETYYDVHPITGIFTQTAGEEASLPTLEPSIPFTTASPSGYPLKPQNNVTMPSVPLVNTYSAASIHKVDGLFMYFGLAFAATAALVSQGWI